MIKACGMTSMVAGRDIYEKYVKAPIVRALETEIKYKIAFIQNFLVNMDLYRGILRSSYSCWNAPGISWKYRILFNSSVAIQHAIIRGGNI